MLGSTIIYVLCVLCVIAAAGGNKPPYLSRLVALKLDQADPPALEGKSLAKKLFHGAKFNYDRVINKLSDGNKGSICSRETLPVDHDEKSLNLSAMHFPMPPLRPLNHRRLKINVDMASQEGDGIIKLLGEDHHIIDYTETRTFRLTDASLKDACYWYHGRRPNDAYLRSPTPWGDLYRRFGWTQVHRKLKPLKATILGIHSKPSIVATQRFRNNTTKTVEYKAGMSQGLAITVSNSWNLQHTINVGSSIEIGVELALKAGTTVSLSYEYQWGKSGSKSHTVTVETSSKVTIPVDPGNAVDVVMTATQGTMEIEVVYEASLYGDVAVNQGAKRWKGHHFWHYAVNSVMQAGGLPRTRQVTEIIKIGFYTDVGIVLHEETGNKRILMADISF